MPLATSADRASRLRQALKALLDDYQRQVETVLPLRQLVKGSVYELRTRCGKPSCHCASDQGPLHTSTVISWSEHGKTRLRTLPPANSLTSASRPKTTGTSAKPAPHSSNCTSGSWPTSIAWRPLSGCRHPSRLRAGGKDNGPHLFSVRPFLRAGSSAPGRHRLPGARLGSRRSRFVPPPHPAAGDPTLGGNLSHTAEKGGGTGLDLSVQRTHSQAPRRPELSRLSAHPALRRSNRSLGARDGRPQNAASGNRRRDLGLPRLQRQK